MKAPEKITIGKSNITSDGDAVFACVTTESDCEAMQHNIEYIRMDAFMEKAERYLKNTLYDRVEIEVFGTLIPSIVSKKEFIDNFKNYMQNENESEN